MSDTLVACPGCGLAGTRRNGRDRQSRQIHQCRGCRRRFTARTATPFSGDHCPPDVIALAVRWYLRFCLSDADVTALLVERGVTVDASTVYDWVREFAPRYEDAARPFRRGVGACWSVDETYARVAGAWVYVYRAIDGQGQIVDVYVSEERAAEDAATFFRRAIASTGGVPDEVTTDCAAALPPVAHETGKRVQQRIERDHQHLKGRLRPMRGFKTLAGARVFCRAHAFLRNLRAQFYDIAWRAGVASPSSVPPVVCAWNALTATLVAR